jgi:ATP-dependent helicase HepA
MFGYRHANATRTMRRRLSPMYIQNEAIESQENMDDRRATTPVTSHRGSNIASWRSGDYLTHRFNPELGIGRITAIETRTIVIDFPRTNTRLRVAADSDALVRIDLSAGRRVRLVATGEETTIIRGDGDSGVVLANGETVAPFALYPLTLEGDLIERLALGDVDDVEDFQLRLDILHLLEIREANGLGSFLGGRVRLFPHQLYVAERATSADPVRWLLADEVGLGKTVEAALIMNRLVHTRQVERCLVVVPDTLTVQWLGELWRKYHQVFTLLDTARLADVARDFGADFNPFDVHRRCVVSLELLIERPQLTEQAVKAGIDLLVVDEAQRLRRPPGHPGEPGWRAVAPIAALGRHVLLLSATPLEEDAHGFFRLLQLLRPDEFPDDVSFEARLEGGTPLPPCTSSTRRADIGGLPPRIGVAVPLPEGGGSDLRSTVEQIVRSRPAHHAVAQRQKIDRVRRALASGAALNAMVGADERPLRDQATAMDLRDPRVEWLLQQATRWRDAKDKTLIFVEHRETLEMLRTALSHRAQLATGVFHEGLSASRRDIEVARFRAADGPSLLVSTESGGEGRNFEFCRRIILFDLPWKPSLIEQRIGRLDRIGRRGPVEIVYFVPPRGFGRDVTRVFEAIGLFREPLAGLEPHLAHVEGALDAIVVDPSASLTTGQFEALVGDTKRAHSRIREAAYQQLHRDPYRPEMAPAILARVPAGLDALNQHVIVAACSRLGFTVEHTRGRRTYAIEFGNEALIDSLPGVPGGSLYVGTFDREEAVEDEALDFFASGHALVEGVFAHFDDSPVGRAARLELELAGEPGAGLIAVYKDGAQIDIVGLDSTGRERPDWAKAIRQRSGTRARVDMAAIDASELSGMIRRLGARLDPARRPHAVAAILVRPNRA